jgi:trk system potassium uptake protein TrkH
MHPEEQIAARRMAAARLAGAAAIAILAQFAVDMPVGYFGPADSSTEFGTIFVGTVLTLTVLGIIGALRGSLLAEVAGGVMLAGVIGTFVPPLPNDPLVSGLAILWSLTAAGALLSRRAEGTAPAHWRPREHDPTGWLARNGPAARHLLGVSVLLAIAVLGFEIGDRVPALATGLSLGALATLLAGRFLVERARSGDRLAWAALAAAAVAILALPRPELALGLLASADALALLLLASRLQLFIDVLDLFYGHPALLVLSSFVVLIVTGTLLLGFPAASATGRPIGLVDAFFTATSAACVTGLIVLDTAADFSRFGQAVILGLIQVGGLNIMVLSTFGALLLGHGLGLRGEKALSELLDIRTPRTAYRLIRFIVLATLGIEAIGAALLSVVYMQRGYGLGSAVWHGLFHAVSAFCNAGFSLHSDSLLGFREEPVFLLLMALLITLGGLGFVVLAFAWRILTHAGDRGLEIQARLVLWVSGILLLAGTVAYSFAEWGRSLAGLSTTDKVVNALFQSVTLRTAGFNSVTMSELAPVTILLMLLFMFIGASPGSTGGGIKTTTAFVLLAAIPALFRQRPQVVVFGRTLGLETVYRSAAIGTTTVVVLFVTAALLLTTQAIAFDSVLFEAFSAVGTVGLSLGATTLLDSFGKVVIMIAMLAGRVGPLTLVLLLGRHLDSRVTYPEARIMVG